MTDAVIVCYQLAEHSGVEFSEHTVLESILGAEDLQTSGHLKDVLGLMRTLFVLSAADQGPVFMRYGYLSTMQSQLIAEEVAALCAEVWPHALNLVHSFGIPQSLLG